MEINITAIFNSILPEEFSASRVELGDKAARITWNNALKAKTRLLTSDEAVDAFKNFIRGFGAWDDAEIEAMTPEALEALFLQFIAGDMREADMDSSWDATDWAEYEAECLTELYSGRIFLGVDGEIYFYVGE
jgi:hypothetical protein